MDFYLSSNSNVKSVDDCILLCVQGVVVLDQELIIIATHLTVLLVAATLFKKSSGSVVSNRIGRDYGRVVNTHTPVCICICSSVCRLSASPPKACDIIGSLYALWFLILSTIFQCVTVISLDFQVVRANSVYWSVLQQ